MAPRQNDPAPPYVAAAAHQPVVIIPSNQRQSNGWGVFGFFVALLGLIVPTGIVAVLGLMICLIASGRSPRGFAVVGVLIGLLGTLIWALIDIAALLALAVGMTLFSTAAFTMTQPEVVELTSDMANVVMAAQDRDDESDAFSLDDLDLTVAARTDPWGMQYAAFTVDNELGFELVSAGPDQQFDTRDDILLSRLDSIWEDAFENFGPRLEAFAQQIQRLEARYGGCQTWSCEADCGAFTAPDPDVTVRERPRTKAEQYEQEAREAERATPPAPARDAA